MELLYRILADVIVTVHFAYVAFVIFGLLLTLAGVILRWTWVRNSWFRLIHLCMIGVVVGEAWLGIICPLSRWENSLRERAGQAAYSGGFFANWLHDMMFSRPNPGCLRSAIRYSASRYLLPSFSRLREFLSEFSRSSTCGAVIRTRESCNRR
jgi:protein-S-isoprenylcysteine O-methyltransferase Ste14